MFSAKEFIIPFVGLKEGKHHYHYKLGNEFFECFEYGLIKKGEVEFNIVFEKMSSMMVLNFEFDGVVIGECDNCLEEVTTKVNGSNRLVVKFGDSLYEETEEILVLAHNDHELDLMQYLYEFVTLSLPARMLHEEAHCDPEVVKRLREMRIDTDSNEEIDPRWAALKGLKNKS